MIAGHVGGVALLSGSHGGHSGGWLLGWQGAGCPPWVSYLNFIAVSCCIDSVANLVNEF